MTDWKSFWHEYPAQLSEEDFLSQVCHTDSGVPYSPQVFDAMIASIVRGLALQENHHLLDICCGNGVVTRRLASHCKFTLGIDFSATLLEIASRHQSADNLDYLLCNALDLNDKQLSIRFNRICMYGALQHFAELQIDYLLQGILRQATDDAIIFIGAIPDAERKHKYFNTPEKLAEHQRYQEEGRDRMGTWWHRDMIAGAAKRAGLACIFDDRSSNRPGRDYRFDLQLSHLD